MDKLSKDQQVIFVCMTVVLVAAFVERYSGTTETATVEEILVGAFIATVLLLLLSYVQSSFAVGLAIITALTMIVAKGKPFWDAIGKITGKPIGNPISTPPPVLSTNTTPTGTYSAKPLPALG